MQHLEAAPGALLGVVGGGLGAAGGLQHADQLADRVAAMAVGDQHRIVGLDHGEVAHARAGDEPAPGVDQAVLAGIEQHVALDGVARRVLRQLLPERVPGAEVGPRGIAGHDGDAPRALHHRLVDRLGRHRLVSLERHLEGAAGRFLQRGEGPLDGVTDRRRVAAELLEDTVGAEQEHAAVPIVPARREHRLGRRARGLLDEARDPQHARGRRQRLARLDVAVAGLGPRRGDAEGHELAGVGHRHGGIQRAIERVGLVHQVVGRADPEQRLAALLLADVERGERDRSRGVAPDRLEQAMVGERRIDRLELAPHQEVLRLGADRDHMLRAGAPEHPTRGLLEQRLRADQRRELLGQGVAAHRPQAGAGAAGEDYGDQHGHGANRPFATGRGHAEANLRRL